MHEIIQNGLEDYLEGRAGREFQAHLDQCASCRSEVDELRDVSAMFSSFRVEFRVEDPVQPDPAFYARLAGEIETARRSSIWSIFSLDAIFGRRVAFASLTALALIGGFLAIQESSAPNLAADEPESIIASHDFLAQHESGADRDHMMLTLASYRQ